MLDRRSLTAAFALLVCVGAAQSIAACSEGDAAAPGPKDLSNEVAPAEPPSVRPTFHEDIAPLLQAHCQHCHTKGGLAPFPLLTFEDARDMAPAMVAETA